MYGNYHGYYSKRPPASDARLGVLPREWFQGATVLDVGCNEGWVTCEVAQNFGARKVVGVDIDESLISGAWRRRRAVWSLQGEAGVPDCFPASCSHEFGSLPVPSAAHRGRYAFPHNVTFRRADWVEEEIIEDKDGYDVVLAFSLTKWVHLNAGDAGIRRLFRRAHSVLRPGGKLVLESQPWETYAKARRTHEHLRETAKRIELRPEDFPGVLRAIGFDVPQHLGTVGDGGK
ncbi:hypothetical protein AX15_007508 [Amanita polypyramis BW_CC]|nr:hypothetical protein AX15_007508 [Amanita polypyramis BW_CC]